MISFRSLRRLNAMLGKIKRSANVEFQEELSENFDLKEFVISETATRCDIDNSIPNIKIYNNIKALCENTLERVRSLYDRPIIVLSGYRCPVLNKKIGGTINSMHMKGQAADIIQSKLNAHDLWLKIVLSPHIQFDQCILEFERWVHISYVKKNKNMQRRKITIAKKIEGKTKYTHYSLNDIMDGKYER